jgi:hypothetical protein
MWSYEHVAEAEVAPETIWSVLADIDGWAEWDTSLEQISLLGPFQVGTEISMTPVGQQPIRSTIVEIVDNRRYADRTEFAGVSLLFSHTLTASAGGTRIVHRLEIGGPTADRVGPELGPAITADFPDAMAALIARAGTIPLASGR